MNRQGPFSRNRKPSKTVGSKSRKPFTLENLEARCMLSVSPNAVEIQPTVEVESVEPIRQYLASNAESSFLFEGDSDLRLLEVAEESGQTLTRFQQTIENVPVYNAFVTVVQNGDLSIEDVFNHGRQNVTNLTVPASGLTATGAEAIAAQNFGSGVNFTSTSPVWFPTGSELTQAWQVNASSSPIANQSFGESLAIIGIDSGDVLSHEKLDSDYFGQFESDTGIFPRIVINDSIGVAGARAFAAPFDSIVSLSQGCSCLLYTSPSPRDKRQSRMPSSA